MKGIVFTGDSFTWGQGLWFYSNLDDIYYPKNCEYIEDKVKVSHILYKDTIRFSRLVTNHFNTFEYSKRTNGGSDDISFKFLKLCFDREFYKDHENLNWLTHVMKNPPKDCLDYNDIDYIIFQTSVTERNSFDFKVNIKDVKLTYEEKQIIQENSESVGPYFTPDNSLWDDDFWNKDTQTFRISVANPTNPVIHKLFIEWLMQNNLRLDEWQDSFYKEKTKILKKELIKYEQNGIKVRILIWMDINYHYIKDDKWFTDRIIKLDYKDGYNTIQKLMEDNEEMMISTDDTFNPRIKDNHPSKRCHEVLAKSIIKKIENE
jgi:hypothetical protein